MGQDLASIIQQLNKDSILTCPSCRRQFNLNSRTPILVCVNQHSFCQECLEEVVKQKQCFQCKHTLIQKRKKNSLLCYILDKLGFNRSQSENSVEGNPNLNAQHMRRNQSVEITQFKTIDTPQRKAIKIKTVKQQSIPNLDLELYKEERQFRKKYSVASIFSSTKPMSTDQPKKNVQESFEQTFGRLAQEYQITPFKNIIANKTDPSIVKNIDLHLYKLPKIFKIISLFKNLQRLNLTKNKIVKIENLAELKQLTYLSLSENQIEFIENLQQLTNLKNLYLNRNKIGRIENLGTLNRLEFLGLAFNAIQKIENVSHLTEIKWLNLQCNYIPKIEGIATLNKLEIILLGSNQVTIFEGFQDYPALQEIHMENNKINDIRKALSMKHLRKIRLQDNPGLKQQNTETYMKLLEIIEAKSKGIEKTDQGCNIY